MKKKSISPNEFRKLFYLSQHSERCVCNGRATTQIQQLQFVTIMRKTFARVIGDFLAMLKIEGLDRIAVLGKRGQRLVAHCLTPAKAELAQEAPATSENVIGRCFSVTAVALHNYLAKFSTTVPSMSIWNSKRSTFCQLEPSSANTFHIFDTWAHLWTAKKTLF